VQQPIADTGQILLGDGAFGIDGYATVAMTAERQIASELNSQPESLLNVAADLNLTTPLLTTGAGVNTSVDVGNHSLVIADSGATVATQAGLGGTLALTGGDITDNGAIRVPSGQVSLHSGAGDISLGSTAVIDVAGTSRQFDTSTVDTWGGTVTLQSDSGIINSEAGSLIDVSGARFSTTGADAGLLRIDAFGQVGLAGDLMGTAASGQRQGSVTLNAETLIDTNGSGNGFSSLNQVLNAGGFSESREFRLRSGDIVVDAGTENSVDARNVVLTADDIINGNIRVNGTVGKVADSSGGVSLNAHGDIVLADGADLIAATRTAGEDGGKVLLASEAGTLSILAGSQVDTTDANGGSSGLLHLRASRIDTDNDGIQDNVAVEPIAGTLNGVANVQVEAVAVDSRTSDVAIDAAQLASWQSDMQSFMDQNGTQIASGLGLPGVDVLPGLELRSTGDITLATNWDLADWRYNGLPGYLTLRARGDVLLNNSIGDGFRTEQITTTSKVGFRTITTTFNVDTLQNDDSWSYRIVGGADIASADPMTVLTPTQLGLDRGNVTLAADTKVRTGTGSIDIASGRDVKLLDTTAVIYSAGTPALQDGVALTPGAVANHAGKYVTWSDNGGDIRINAAGDLIGVASDQSPNSWLWRQGGESGLFTTQYTETNWAVDFNGFQQGIAAFGGGNINLSAGGDISNLSAAIPTTGKQTTPGADRSIIDTWGGGDLGINAGGDVFGGVYLLGDGRGYIHSSGSITTDGRVARGNTAYPLLALGKGQFHLETGADLTLVTVTQPTAFPRVPEKSTTYNNTSEFITYDPAASVDLISLGGNVTLQPVTGVERLFADTSATGMIAASYEMLKLLPPSLNLMALSGSVTIPNQVIMQPSPLGDLHLLADQDINAWRLLMSDYDPALLPSPNAPLENLTTLFEDLNKYRHASIPLHQGDSEPVSIVTTQGDISGIYFLPKASRIIAGRDIRGIGFTGQHTNADDMTLLHAGHDIRFTQAVAVATEKIQLDGPGRLDVIAGRHINLGASKGIISVGNLNNSVLADDGADISVMAGVGAGMDLNGFIDRYLTNGDTYRNEVTAYKQVLTGQDLSADEALQAFLVASAEQQQPLVIDTLFAELKNAGRTVATGNATYDSGYQALDTLFPAERDYAGNLSMYLSRIYSTDGGNIDILVPGGSVNAGLALPAAELKSRYGKSASDLGIVAQRQGDVMALTYGDFVVNQSRVFTLLGGDIVMWSSFGNIDAGRGAKSAIAAPEPTLTFDNDGNVVIDLGGAIAGSGIRAITTSPDIAAGDVDLYAPVGFIDAGDAGIGGNNVFVAGGLGVIGSDNFDVGGISVGVPVASTTSLAAGLTGVSNLASSVGTSAEDSVSNTTKESSDTPLADAALGFLEVDVLGFGSQASQSEPGSADDAQSGQPDNNGDSGASTFGTKEKERENQ